MFADIRNKRFSNIFRKLRFHNIFRVHRIGTFGVNGFITQCQGKRYSLKHQ